MVTSRTDPQSWKQAKRILGEALERPAAERLTFIAEACRGDEELACIERRVVEMMEDELRRAGRVAGSCTTVIPYEGMIVTV